MALVGLAGLVPAFERFKRNAKLAESVLVAGLQDEDAAIGANRIIVLSVEVKEPAELKKRLGMKPIEADRLAEGGDRVRALTQGDITERGLIGGIGVARVCDRGSFRRGERAIWFPKLTVGDAEIDQNSHISRILFHRIAVGGGGLGPFFLSGVSVAQVAEGFRKLRPEFARLTVIGDSFGKTLLGEQGVA